MFAIKADTQKTTTITSSQEQSIRNFKFSRHQDDEKVQIEMLIHENSELSDKLQIYEAKLHQLENQIKQASNRITSDMTTIEKLMEDNRELMQKVADAECIGLRHFINESTIRELTQKVKYVDVGLRHFINETIP